MHRMVKYETQTQSEEDQKTNKTPIFKILEILVSLVYVLYDSFTEDPPGPGTTALIVVTCLAEVFLICQEGITLWKSWKYWKNRSPTVTQMTSQGAAPEMMSEYPIHASAGYPMQSVSHGPEYIHTPANGRPIEYGQPMF